MHWGRRQEVEVVEEEEEEVEAEVVVMEDMWVVVEVVISSQFSSFSWDVPSSWPVFGGTLIGDTLFARPTLTQVVTQAHCKTLGKALR